MLKKYTNIIILLLSLILGIILSSKIIPNSITSSIIDINSKKSDKHKEKLNKIYDVNFLLSKNLYGNTNTYLIDRKDTMREQALYYSNLFDMENMQEDDDSFFCENKDGRLEILKKVNMFRYYNSNILNCEKVDKNDIIEIALNFLEGKIMFGYEEAVVNLEGDIYKVNFINRLGNIKNYSFPNNMQIDTYGNILCFEYYFMDYKKFNSVKLRTVKDAFLDLPIDFDDDVVIDLSGCQLVYFYEDSIVQPAYQFLGELSGGRSFECFVKASDFK